MFLAPQLTLFIMLIVTVQGVMVRLMFVLGRAGTSTQVPKVRVRYTNYPGAYLLFIMRMLIIEYKTEKKSMQKVHKFNMTSLYKWPPRLAKPHLYSMTQTIYLSFYYSHVHLP